jgi:hypothetical protein
MSGLTKCSRATGSGVVSNCGEIRAIFCWPNCARARVTRLGEFSPIERMFTYGSFLKIKEVAKRDWPAVFQSKSCVLILTKIWVGLHFG